MYVMWWKCYFVSDLVKALGTKDDWVTSYRYMYDIAPTMGILPDT